MPTELSAVQITTSSGNRLATAAGKRGRRSGTDVAARDTCARRIRGDARIVRARVSRVTVDLRAQNRPARFLETSEFAGCRLWHVKPAMRPAARLPRIRDVANGMVSRRMLNASSQVHHQTVCGSCLSCRRQPMFPAPFDAGNTVVRPYMPNVPVGPIWDRPLSTWDPESHSCMSAPA